MQPKWSTRTDEAELKWRVGAPYVVVYVPTTQTLITLVDGLTFITLPDDVTFLALAE